MHGLHPPATVRSTWNIGIARHSCYSAVTASETEFSFDQVLFALSSDPAAALELFISINTTPLCNLLACRERGQQVERWGARRDDSDSETGSSRPSATNKMLQTDRQNKSYSTRFKCKQNKIKNQRIQAAKIERSTMISWLNLNRNLEVNRTFSLLYFLPPSLLCPLPFCFWSKVISVHLEHIYMLKDVSIPKMHLEDRGLKCILCRCITCKRHMQNLWIIQTVARGAIYEQLVLRIDKTFQLFKVITCMMKPSALERLCD